MRSVRSSWSPAAILAPLFLAFVACDDEPSGPDEVIQTTPWEVVDLAAVNDAGVVVGTVRRDSMNLTSGETFIQLRVATWTQDGGVAVVPMAAGMAELLAIDVNEAGHVLAGASDSTNHHHALLWNGTAWRDLGAFYPTAMDEDDNVVGYLWDWESESMERTPVVHVAGATTYQELSGTPAPNVCEVEPSSIPLDISGAGIVGVTFLWAEAVEWVSPADADLLFTYESCVTAEESTAQAIDDEGHIVGWSGELGMAYIRRPGAEPEGLGALPGAPTGVWASSCAYDIAGGWIAGRADSETGWRAVRWNGDLEIEDLGLGTLYRINADGMAVGESGNFAPTIWLPDGRRLEFSYHEPTLAAPRAPQSLPC